MGLLESIGKGFRKDEDFKAAQKSEKINRIVSERKKSSNERILEKFQEEKRQEAINAKVKQINTARNDELFNTPFKPEQNIFKQDVGMLKVKPTMLKSNKNPVLETKNIFFK